MCRKELIFSNKEYSTYKSEKHKKKKKKKEERKKKKTETAL